MFAVLEGDTMVREQWRRAVLVAGCVGAVVAATERRWEVVLWR